jgi:DNA-binding SARP family transcriptional activator
MSAMRLPPRAVAGLVAITLAGVALLILTAPSDRTLSLVFETDRQYDAAVNYLKRWTRRHPDDYEARLHTADLQVMTVHPEDALRTLEKLADEWPRQPAVLRRLVDIEDSLLMVDATRAQLERLAQVTPGDQALLRRLADHYRWNGMTEPLLRTLLALVRTTAAPPERLELVDILQANRRYDELIAWLAPNIARMPEQVELRIALYEAYARSGRTRQALAELRRLIDLAPERLELLRDWADALAAQGRIDDAVALYRQRIARAGAPAQAEALRRELDDLYGAEIERRLLASDRAGAVRLARAQVAAAPFDVGLRLALADLYGASADQVAVRELQDLVARAPTDLVARRALAQAFEWTNQPAGALEQYRFLARSGGNDGDREELVRLLLDAEQGPEALAVAHKLRPSPEHRHLLGLAAHAAHQWDIAIVELLAWTAQHPDDQAAWQALVEAATESGRPDLALRALGHVRHKEAARKVEG